MKKQLSDKQLSNYIGSTNFADSKAALRSVHRITEIDEIRPLMPGFLPVLITAIEQGSNPDRTLISFENFLKSAVSPKNLIQFLQSEPRVLEMLAILFSGSQFLTEILLRYPDYFEQIKNPQYLAQPKSPQQFYAEAQAAVMHFQEPAQKLDALRRFQRWELLRIGASDLFGLLDLQTVTGQLSHLADTLIKLCLNIVVHTLNVSPEGFAVFALGKLGGNELNYSSDIDLLFLSRQSAPVYQRLGQRLIEALTRKSGEGFLYRVDMRLRPWGGTGTLVPNLKENLTYLKNHARLWEKQAMLKLRFIAGDDQLGVEFIRKTKPLIYDLPVEELRKEVRSMKKQVESKLRRKGQSWGEVKSGEGSIRDVEFITQFLQLTRGKNNPEVRSRNTLNALARLVTANILPEEDFRTLSEGYRFLRTVEHYLQMMHYQQTHLLPDDEREMTYLARRLGFEGDNIGQQLLQRYQQHSSAIRKLYHHYLDSRKDKKLAATVADIKTVPGETTAERLHTARMDPSYMEIFSEQEIAHHASLAGKLNVENILEVEAIPLENKEWKVTIVGFDFLGELSIICGLLFCYGFDIVRGDIFTYEPQQGSVPLGSERRTFNAIGRRPKKKSGQSSRSKIVDVFTVRSVRGGIKPDIWQEYKDELSGFLRLLKAKKYHEAHGELAKRVAVALKKYSSPAEILLPVDIEIDNSASENYTILRIDAQDTIGFLYEFTNALSLNSIYIARVTVNSVGNRIHDTMFVTDALQQKITEPERQRELRAAIVLVKQFTHLLPRSPNPESAMLHFRELVSHLFTRPDWPDTFASLERPEVLDALAKLLGVSDFLWDDFLRMQHGNLFPILKNPKELKKGKTRSQLLRELEDRLSAAGDITEKRAVLNSFKDREMFRIDMRYIQGEITKFQSFSRELSDLAEVIVEKAYHLSYGWLVEKYGEPKIKGEKTARSCLCGLGKFGGREIGFASDIELMLIYEGRGHTSKEPRINNSEFFNKLTYEIQHSIKSRRKGIFEIDLRLRPYGRAGNRAVLLESFHKYFVPGGVAWDYERQALVKLRPVAGDMNFARKVIRVRDECVYNGLPFKTSAMHAMRERQIRQLVAGGSINAKYSPGGLVDLEYLVQGLQIIHGVKTPGLRVTNTLKALSRLKKEGIIKEREYEQLRQAYIYIRKLIEALRMVRGNARDLTVPNSNSEEFAFLARRLNYNGKLKQFQKDIMYHTSVVQKFSARLLP